MKTTSLYLMILVLLTLIANAFVLVETGTTQLQNFHLCDPGVALETVQVCYDKKVGAQPVVPQVKVLDSISVLAATNAKPFQEGAFTLLYDPPLAGQPKQVSIHYTKDVTTEKNFPANQFMANFLAGQRLVLTLEGEYYLLSYESSGYFTSANLRLTHIPTKQQFLPAQYPGTSWHIFNVLGQKRIAVGAFGPDFKITALQPGETPAAYVLPQNLSQLYEVTFSKGQPVEITAPMLGTFTVCQSDNNADTQQVQVCLNNVLAFTLQAGTLTKRTVNAQNYTFLFAMSQGVKQVSIFSHQVLNSVEQQLTYNDFINNLVQGRRISLEFPAAGTLYLLKHPVATVISLPSLSLVAHTGSSASTFSASGSESEVEFSAVGGGKIFLQRNYGNPPPPFSIWGLKAEELVPVDLERDLSTSFSSITPINIYIPNLGSVGKSASDITLDSTVFKVSGSASEDIILRFKEPQTKEAALFYYHQANLNQGLPVKSVAVYLFYALKPDQTQANSPFHTYDDTFITRLTTGKELALKFEDSYYRLSHDNPQGQPVFFDVSKLRLRTLDGNQVFNPANQDASTASFNVPEGKIHVEVDSEAGKIYFRAETSTALITEQFPQDDYDYLIELTPENRVELKDSDGDKNNNIVLRMCFLTAYANTQAARVCNDNIQQDQFFLSGARVDLTYTLRSGSNFYFLESNQLTGANKKVIIRKIIFFNSSMPQSFPDWITAAGKFSANEKPIFNVNTIYYLPFAQDARLQTFGLGKFPGGFPAFPQKLEQKTPITQKATLVLNDTVLRVMQMEMMETAPISTYFKVESYRYLPESKDKIGGLALPQQSSPLAYFVTVLDGTIYNLISSEVTINVVRLKLEAEKDGEIITLIDRYFAAGETKSIILDGVRTLISVEDILIDSVDPQQVTGALITVKRE